MELARLETADGLSLQLAPLLDLPVDLFCLSMGLDRAMEL